MLKGRQELEEELELAEEVEGQWTCRCAGLQAATWKHVWQKQSAGSLQRKQ